MVSRRIFRRVSLGGIFCLALVFAASPASAGHGSNLVISEVQITGGAGLTTNDFVEIYNPTAAPVDLDGHRLVKRTATGTTDTTLKSWTTSALVPAHGYYLWANSGFTTIAAVPEATTSGALADNNGVALRMGAENTGVVLDSVAWGNAVNDFVEGAAFPTNPGANESIERLPTGAEGNATDTGNNTADFVLRVFADPQNSASAPRPELPPSPPPAEPPPPEPSGPLPGDVVINEFMPNPADGIEWVETYNRTSMTVDLTGFKLIDGTEATIKSLSGMLSPGGFTAFDLSSARLNNSGDIVALKNVEGLIIDNVSYGDWDDGNTADNAPAPEKSGQSLSRKSNGADTGVDRDDFALSDGPTKGSSNVIVETIVTGRPTELEEMQVAPTLIVINEFVSDPSDGEEEWVELYNAGATSVNLEGWYLEEGAERKTKFSGTIIPGQFAVAETIAGNLNNKGDVLRLKNPQGEVIDWVSYGAWEDGALSDNAPVATDPNALARRADGLDSGRDIDDFAVTAVPTKGKPNLIRAPEGPLSAPPPVATPKTATPPSASTKPAQPAAPPSLPTVVLESSVPVALESGRLMINEILPNPEGSDEAEFVELLWLGTQELNLQGFQVDDGEGGSRPFTLGEIKVQPRYHVLLPRALTKLALNNDGDAVRLFDPAGASLNEVEYEGSVEGKSYARRPDEKWFWTTPTPGRLNVFGADARPEAENADNDRSSARASRAVQEVPPDIVRQLEVGARVKTAGVVIAPPSVLGAQIFYVNGLQVYMFKKDFPLLALGNRTELQGEVSEAFGEKRLKIRTREDIKVLDSGAPPAPLRAAVDELSDEYIGMLIKVEGTIIDLSRSGILIDDQSGELTMAVKKSTNIDTRELAAGLQVAVTGIIQRTSSGFRILPRFPEDIEIVGADELLTGSNVGGADKGSGSHPYTKTTAAASGGAVLAAAALSRRKMFLTGIRALVFALRRGKAGGGMG